MRNILVTVGILMTFLSATEAHSVSPFARSTTCLALLQTLRHEAPQMTLADRDYVLNSLRSVGNELAGTPLDGNKVAPNTAEGTVIERKYSRGFDPIQAAGRIKGILDFNNQSDEGSEERRFMLMTTVTGLSNIEGFLDSLFARSRRGSLGGNFFGGFYSSMSLLSGYVLQMLVPDIGPDAGIVNAAFALPFVAAFGFISVASAEGVFRLAISRINSLKAEMNSLKEAAARLRSNSWSLLSANFSISKETVEYLMKEKMVSDRSFGAQEITDTTPKLYIANAMMMMKIFESREERENFRRAIDESIKNRTWIGLDLLLTRDSEGEPELYIIMRGTHKSPPFPKTSPKPKRDSNQQKEWGLGPRDAATN